MIPIQVDHYRYELADDWYYSWEVTEGDYTYYHDIAIYQGTKTDGNSVPRIAWTISGILPDGLNRAAGLVHDIGYRYQGDLDNKINSSHTMYVVHKDSPNIKKQVSPTKFTRKQMDKLYARLLREAGEPEKKRRKAYKWVRLLGWYAWLKD